VRQRSRKGAVLLGKDVLTDTAWQPQ
jgi:hypothetical protein